VQWLQQDPNQNNVYHLSNVRREASGYVRKKKREYLKFKINEIETDRKTKNTRDLYRGFNDCKRGYQPRNNIV